MTPNLILFNNSNFSYCTNRSQEVQDSFYSQRDGTSSSKMLPLLQEQGECGLWNDAPSAFCGRKILPIAQTSDGPRQVVVEIIAKSQSFYSHIPSHVSTAVSPIPKFAFSIWAASVPMSMNFPSASTWSPTSTSNCLLKLSKLPVSARTSMFLSIPYSVRPHLHEQILTGIST